MKQSPRIGIGMGDMEDIGIGIGEINRFCKESVTIGNVPGIRYRYRYDLYYWYRYRYGSISKNRYWFGAISILIPVYRYIGIGISGSVYLYWSNSSW